MVGRLQRIFQIGLPGQIPLCYQGEEEKKTNGASLRKLIEKSPLFLDAHISIFFFQVPAQVLPEVQPELSQERGEPTGHEAVPGKNTTVYHTLTQWMTQRLLLLLANHCA